MACSQSASAPDGIMNTFNFKSVAQIKFLQEHALDNIDILHIISKLVPSTWLQPPMIEYRTMTVMECQSPWA